MKTNLLNLIIPHSKRKLSKTVCQQLEFHLAGSLPTRQEVHFLAQLRHLKQSLAESPERKFLKDELRPTKPRPKARN